MWYSDGVANPLWERFGAIRGGFPNEASCRFHMEGAGEPVLIEVGALPPRLLVLYTAFGGESGVGASLPAPGRLLRGEQGARGPGARGASAAGPG